MPLKKKKIILLHDEYFYLFNQYLYKLRKRFLWLEVESRRFSCSGAEVELCQEA